MNSNLKNLLTFLNQEADLIDRCVTNCDWPYKSTQRLVLDKGISFQKSIKPFFKGEPKQCYQNCFKALWRFPNLYYCEGFALHSDISLAFAHAWLVNDRGEVIDPTWHNKKDYANCAYFGVAFDREFVMDMAEKNKVYGILENDLMNEHILKREGFPQHALASQFHHTS